MRGIGAGGRGVWAVAAAALLAGGCSPWRCQFYSHGACIEFSPPPADLAATQARVDALLDRELPYWGLSSLSGWRIHFRDWQDEPCYVAASSSGCTDYLEKTISVHVPSTSNGCFEAAEVLHELGHYALGDPMHSHDLWKGVEASFPQMVWDFQGAPVDCVVRYRGITAGMWVVGVNAF